jgi:hypothetical protein
MNKPVKKDYCKPFIFDDKYVTFDSKQYAKDAALYIEHIEKINDNLYKLLERALPKIRAISNYTLLADDIEQALTTNH